MNFVFLFRTQLMWTSLEFGVWPFLVWSILMTVSANEERNGPFSEWKLLINKLTVYSFNHFSKVSTVAAAAASLQSCPTLCDPIDGSPPGFPSLGFSKQEHWSGLPFPSPMHESEKWKWSRSVVSDSSRPHGLQPTRLLRPWDFPGKSTNNQQNNNPGPGV